jgi:acetoin utilization deacetylase AcuC-like enzyme
MRIYNSPYHQLHDIDNVVKDGQRFVIEEVPMQVEIIRRAISRFNADWLVLSAGFDIGDGDPVG